MDRAAPLTRVETQLARKHLCRGETVEQIVVLFMGRYLAEEIEASLEHYRSQKRVQDERARAKRDGVSWKMPSKRKRRWEAEDVVDAALTYSHEQYIEMNDRFCRAMRGAVSKGLEYAQVGIITTPMTDMARIVRPSGVVRTGNCCLADA